MASVIAERLNEVIKRMEARQNLKDQTKVRMGNIGVSGIKSNFEGNNPLGWAALSPNTIAKKKSSRILFDKGHMKNSIFFRIISDGLEFFTRDKKAPWHQFGTGPYEIRPKKKKALAFTTTIGLVITRFVKHPGLKARPFMVLRPEIIEQMFRPLKEWWRDPNK